MMSMRLQAVLMAAVLILTVSLTASAQSFSVNLSIGRSPYGADWSSVFELERDVTYTYELQAVRWGRPSQTGELEITRVGSSFVRLAYKVGSASGAVTAPYDPQAMAGALLLDALTNTSLDYVGLQMLATPFKFTPWLEQFSQATFRSGRVWEISGHPPVRFDAQPKGWRFESEWEGEVRRGSTTLLLLEIDLGKPLPAYIESRDGDYRYTAQLRAGRSYQRILR